MTRIKSEVKQIVGKRISGLVVKEATNKTQPPFHQLFLLFDDGTYYEFYTHDCSICTTGGVCRGGIDDVLSYMAETYKPIFIDAESKNSSLYSCRDINISDLADNETQRLYGKPPEAPERAGFLTFATFSAGVPLFLPLIDALSHFFGYELLARNAQVIPVFLTLGIVAGTGVYLYQTRARRKWLAHNIEIYRRLQSEHKQDAHS